ncbi:MAG: glycosyltransferase [Phycisphaerales bacterium]|nr:glycosyltransferase [Phycisphaerales bacterium]
MVLVVSVWILCAFSLAGTAYWCVVFWRVERDGRNRPALSEGLSIQRAQWPRVSIIIPAHNEESHAPDLLRSLDAQIYPGEIEVIFVLDRCTDGTRSAIERARGASGSSRQLHLIDNASCPDDWAGKCNAARVGSDRASGELLLFTDADTTFEADLVRSSVALFLDRGLSLLSALPEVSVRQAFEAAVQPVAAIQLMKLYPIARVNAETNPRAFANGQFMLFSRESYNALGGHAAVKNDLLEDLAFARRMVHVLKRRAGLFVADGLLHVRMYESFSQFREGWRRILIEACHRNPSRMSRYAAECTVIGPGVSAIAALALATGAAALAGGDAPLGWSGIASGALALVAQGGTLARIYRIIGVPMIAVLAHPYASLIVASILRQGARDLRARRPVRWGGRQYVLEPQTD